MHAAYPAAGTTPRDEAAVGRWDTVREVIRATRNIQAENQLKKGGDIFLNAATDEIKASVAASESLVRYLTKCDAVHFEVGPEDGFLAVTSVGEVRLPRPSATPEVIEAERKRLSGELAKIDKDLAGLAGRLSDPTFAEKAPEAVVAKARGQQAELLERRGKVAERLEHLD
jgi:valyl-tRNA synthetase